MLLYLRPLCSAFFVVPMSLHQVFSVAAFLQPAVSLVINARNSANGTNPAAVAEDIQIEIEIESMKKYNTTTGNIYRAVPAEGSPHVANLY